jgi:Flp pilus assembly protein TadD
MGNRRLRVTGIVGALSSGLLVCYFGFRLSHSAGAGPPVTSVATTRQQPAPDQHEALILAEALKKKPNHTPVLLRMAQLSEASGKHSEAAAQLREVLGYEPANTDAHLELGRVLFQAGDVTGAIEQTQWILERHPEHAEALYNLGAIYANLGNADYARRYWGRLLLANPQSESAQRANGMLARLPATRAPVEKIQQTAAIGR